MGIFQHVVGGSNHWKNGSRRIGLQITRLEIHLIGFKFPPMRSETRRLALLMQPLLLNRDRRDFMERLDKKIARITSEGSGNLSGNVISLFQIAANAPD